MISNRASSWIVDTENINDQNLGHSWVFGAHALMFFCWVYSQMASYL